MKKKILAVIIAAMAVMSGCAGEAAESTSPILDVEPVELATEVPAIEPEAEIKNKMRKSYFRKRLEAIRKMPKNVLLKS